MHLASNLLFDCDREQAVTQRQALVDLYDWLMEVRGNNNKVRLAGFSPHFDRSFLLASMPELADHIHHQVIDVSTIRHVFQLGGSPIYPTGDGAIHRAYADTHQAISMYEQSIDLIKNRITPNDLNRNEKND
jgi:oligoribonuclease (3'-5' exoribonuclease)